MTYQITFTSNSVTLRKGRIGMRTTVTPALCGAYASLYALHGDKVLPSLWADLVAHAPAKGFATPCTNADATLSVAYVPTGCSYSVPAMGATMQRRVNLDHLRAQGVETQYQSKNYYVK